MNQLAVYDFETMDESSLELMSTQIYNIRLNRIQKQLEEMANNQTIMDSKFEIKFDELNSKADNAIDIAMSNKRIEEKYDGYYNQSQFGEMFKLKVSNQKVGLLLKIVGIAKKSSAKTIPYDDKCPKYAKIIFVPDRSGQDRSNYLWNYSACIIKIEKWLEDHDLFEDYSKCETNGQLERFIKNTYEDFRDGLFD